MIEYIYEETPSGSDVFGRPVDAPMLTRREKIVRCRDCRYYEDTGFCNWFECSYCNEFQRVEPDGFCAWGERKEGCVMGCKYCSGKTYSMKSPPLPHAKNGMSVEFCIVGTTLLVSKSCASKWLRLPIEHCPWCGSRLRKEDGE